MVDDKADVRLSARFLLSNYGFLIEEADSPTAALSLIQKQHVDLVLLDMNFALDTTSGEEGLYFLRKLKKIQQDNAKMIPVVAMTAWANTELVVKALKLNATDFIEKPWDNNRLILVIEGALKLSQVEQQNQAL